MFKCAQQLRQRTSAHWPLGLRRWLFGAVVMLTLLQALMPTLGLMHRVIHNPDTAGQSSQSKLTSVAGNHIATGQDNHSLTQHLFGEHTSADCQFFDHLLLGIGVIPALLAFSAAAPLMRSQWSLQALLLRQSPALFHARAPPRG